MEKFDDLIKKIESLTVVEMAELVKALETKFGISAAAPVAAGNQHRQSDRDHRRSRHRAKFHDYTLTFWFSDGKRTFYRAETRTRLPACGSMGFPL